MPLRQAAMKKIVRKGKNAAHSGGKSWGQVVLVGVKMGGKRVIFTLHGI